MHIVCIQLEHLEANFIFYIFEQFFIINDIGIIVNSYLLTSGSKIIDVKLSMTARLSLIMEMLLVDKLSFIFDRILSTCDCK